MKPRGKLATVKAPTSKKLDEDRVVEMVADGCTQLEIAAAFETTRGKLRHWLAADPARSARAREAAAQAAQAYAEGAIEVIRAASDPFELAKAREVAQHLRWAAGKANPASYGDKQQIDLDAKVTLTREQVDAKLGVLLAKINK